MQGIPNGGRPLRFIRLVRPQLVPPSPPPPASAPAPIYSESFQEVQIPEIPKNVDNK